MIIYTIILILTVAVLTNSIIWIVNLLKSEYHHPDTVYYKVSTPEVDSQQFPPPMPGPIKRMYDEAVRRERAKTYLTDEVKRDIEL